MSYYLSLNGPFGQENIIKEALSATVFVNSAIET